MGSLDYRRVRWILGAVRWIFGSVEFATGGGEIPGEDSTVIISLMLGSTILTPEEIEEYQRLVEIKDSLGGYVFSYIAEMAFLFMMLFGMLKGTEKLVHKIFGV